MIIIRKKRIVIVCLCIVLSFCFVAVGKSLNFNKEETQIVVSLPVSNKVVVLDAGHGSPDRTELKVKMVHMKMISILQ